LFSTLEAGEFVDTIKPGLLSYEALMASYTRSEAWVDVLDIYTKLATHNIITSTRIDYYKLQALAKTSSCQSNTVSFLKSLLTEGRNIDIGSIMLSLQIFFPDILLNVPTVDTLDDDISRLRYYLLEQSKMDDNKTQKAQYNKLVRALQIANTEQTRFATGGLTEGVLEKRRSGAWKEVMRCLLDYNEQKQQLQQL
jgi:hypothetical protein